MSAPAPVNPPASSPSLPAAEGAEAVNAHETAGGTTAVQAHGGEGGGLPQFRVEYWGGQIVWLLILFAILFVLIAKVFAPRMRRALEEREQTIEGAIAEARAVQAEADAQAEAGRREVTEARARAQRTGAEAKAAAFAQSTAASAAEEERLGAHLVEAEASIAATRQAAMGNVRAIAAETAAGIVERLTGRPAAPVEIDAALPAQGTA